MKLLDLVKLIKDRPQYSQFGVRAGMTGTVIDATIRNNEFLVAFPDERNLADNCIGIKIGDLELVKDNKSSDEMLLDDIPKCNPKWWCKVENGYIVNLLGERKNKIPYDYES